MVKKTVSAYLLENHSWSTKNIVIATGTTEAVARRCCAKKVLKNFVKVIRKPLCQGLFVGWFVGCRFATLLKETQAQGFSSEFFGIFQSNFL